MQDLIVHRIAKALLAAGIDGHRELPRKEASSATHRRSHIRHHQEAAIEIPVEEQEPAAIAQEVSQCERRAADAERELIEREIRFMHDKIGDKFLE